MKKLPEVTRRLSDMVGSMGRSVYRVRRPCTGADELGRRLQFYGRDDTRGERPVRATSRDDDDQAADRGRLAFGGRQRTRGECNTSSGKKNRIAVRITIH